MKLPIVSLISKKDIPSIKPSASEALVAFVRKGDLERPRFGLGNFLDQEGVHAHARELKRRGFEANPNDAIHLAMEHGLLVLIGLGKDKKVPRDIIRHAAANALKLSEQLKIERATFVVPESLATPTDERSLVGALTEGILLGGYEFDKYITGSEKKFSCKEVRLGVRGLTAALKTALDQATIVSNAVNEARDMQNDNSDEVNPEMIAKRAANVAREHKLKFSEISGNVLITKGLNLLHAVGRASPWPPRLLLLEYRGAPKSQAPIVVVGKGITFDTGGVNLKPTRGMIEQMHLDMSGAAAALAVVKVAAELKFKTNVIAVLAIAENALSGNSYKPGSVIKAHNGTTVEVTNTDAEGRLALADANAYASKTFKPAAIVDIATLTGTVLMTFGEEFAGLIANHDGLSENLMRASHDSDEQLWPLPLTKEYRSNIKGIKSDVVNTVMSGAARADTIQAMAFLERFTGETPAALIDIAGTSMRSRKTGYLPVNGTGFGIRLLVEFLKGSPKGPRASAWGSRGLGRYA